MGPPGTAGWTAGGVATSAIPASPSMFGPGARSGHPPSWRAKVTSWVTSWWAWSLRKKDSGFQPLAGWNPEPETLRGRVQRPISDSLPLHVHGQDRDRPAGRLTPTRWSRPLGAGGPRNATTTVG